LGRGEVGDSLTGAVHGGADRPKGNGSDGVDGWSIALARTSRSSVESVGSSGRWLHGGSMARHGCHRGGACSGEMRRHRLRFWDSSMWIAARSMVRLVEGVGVREGLEAGACRWQLTAARCVEEWRHGSSARRDRGGARWRWKQGSRVGLLFSLEQRIRAGAHVWGGVILGAVETGVAVVPWARWWWETVGAGSLAATAGARGRKTPWWLTCAPSVPFNLIRFFKASTSKFTNMIFRMSKNGETF
jgi:hypothetical protein